MQKEWRNGNVSGPSKSNGDCGINNGKAVSLSFTRAPFAGKHLRRFTVGRFASENVIDRWLHRPTDSSTSMPCLDGRSDACFRKGGLKWDNMMTEPPITPKFMGPHGVELPLYSISHELAWLMTVTSKAQDDRADFNNFYAHLTALFHQ